jgi:ATP-binding cassette subfamily B protein
MPRPRKSFHPLEWSYISQSPFRTLWRWADCSPWKTLGMLLMFVIKQSPAWAVPLVTARLIDAVTVNPQGWRSEGPAIGVLLVLLAGNVPIHTAFIRMLSGLTRRLEGRLRQALVTRLQQLSIPYHDENESGRLQAKVLRDVEQVQGIATQVGEHGVMAVTSLVAMVAITLNRQPLVLLIYVVLVPLLLGIVFVISTAAI